MIFVTISNRSILLHLPHYPGSNYNLSFVIILIILNCRKIDEEIKNICDLRVDTIIQSASKCLITINPSLKVPTKLPSGISHRIEVAAQIASICKVTISVLIKSFPIVYIVFLSFMYVNLCLNFTGFGL